MFLLQNLQKTLALLDKITSICSNLDIKKIKELDTQDKEKAIGILYRIQSKVDFIIRVLFKLRNELVEKMIELESEENPL